MRFGRSFPLRARIIRAVAAVAGLISGSDVNGATTETASLVAQISASADASGVTTESSTEAVQITATDTNGATSEGGSIGLSGADSGGATETAALAAAESSSDVNGATTETSALSAQEAGADSSGTETETSALTAQLAGADADGAAAESSTLAAQLAATDADGATVESGAVGAAPTLVSGADTNSTTIEIGSVEIHPAEPPVFTPGKSRLRGRGMPLEPTRPRSLEAHDFVKLEVVEEASVRDLTAEQRRAEEELLLTLV